MCDEIPLFLCSSAPRSVCRKKRETARLRRAQEQEVDKLPGTI